MQPNEKREKSNRQYNLLHSCIAGVLNRSTHLITSNNEALAEKITSQITAHFGGSQLYLPAPYRLKPFIQQCNLHKGADGLPDSNNKNGEEYALEIAKISYIEISSQTSLKNTVSNRLAIEITLEVSMIFGGKQFYVPNVRQIKINQRHDSIITDLNNGMKVKDIAQKHELTTASIYNVIKKFRSKKRKEFAGLKVNKH